MRPLLEFVLAITLLLFPIGAGALALYAGLPWWVALLVTVVLYYFVRRGFAGEG